MCKLSPVVNAAWVTMGSTGPVCPHLYAAGSGESDGLAKRFAIIGLNGRFRVMPLGGIGQFGLDRVDNAAAQINGEADGLLLVVAVGKGDRVGIADRDGGRGPDLVERPLLGPYAQRQCGQRRERDSLCRRAHDRGPKYVQWIGRRVAAGGSGDALRTKVTGDHQGAKRCRWASVLTAWLGGAAIDFAAVANLNNLNCAPGIIDGV